MDHDSGSMDYETFVKNIKEIVNISDLHNDGWKLITTPDNIVFIIKILHRPITDNCQDTQIEDDLSISQFEDSNVITTNFLTVKWEYDIIYSESFQVPVFYFNAWRHNGSVLTLQEIWDTLNCDKLSTDLYSMITQMEHPIHGSPYFRLHPCKSTEIIENFQKTSNNLVASWISSVGHYICLDFLDTIYYNCTVKN